MIMQPEPITQEIKNKAIEEFYKKELNESIKLLRLEDLKEGKSAQIDHIGPFSKEYDNIMKLHDLIKKSGGKFSGEKQKHNEIYLSDFRKTAPEKMRTVLRQPFV